VARGVWGLSAKKSGFKLAPHEKLAIGETCEKIVSDIFIPHCLPTVTPSDFNYPIKISGGWYGQSYRFATRYRSGFPENLGEEFDAPFSRIEFVARDRANLAYFRHTGQWWTIFHAMPTAEALAEISSNKLFWPNC
jgi:hypothetical protein